MGQLGNGVGLAIADLAQLAELAICNRAVFGSTPKVGSEQSQRFKQPRPTVAVETRRAAQLAYSPDK